MKTPNRSKGQDICQQHREFSKFVPPHLKMTDLNIEPNHRKRRDITNK
jgi:hypothetical protein